MVEIDSSISVPGSHTLQEILSQPDVWTDALQCFRSQSGALARFWEQHPADQVIFTGCGSTYYLSLTAAALFQSLTGISASARPASELLFFPERLLLAGKRTLLVAVSRSGSTTETVAALHAFKQRTQGSALVITCDSHSPLAGSADLLLAVDRAQEVSVAQTRSFTSMALLAQCLAAQASGQDPIQALAPAPQSFQQLLEDALPLAKQLGEDPTLQRFFFLGAGYLYGLACEAMLKMKEMSLSYAEAFHPLEFRHGPMSMVDASSLVVGLVSPEAASQETAVLRQMHALGGRLLAISGAPLPGPALPGNTLLLAAALPGWAQPVFYLPALQLLAYYRAIFQCQDPDQPHNLTAVVSLDPLTSS